MDKQRLSPEVIVQAAIHMADEKGLAAVTLRGIAARLNVHVTSLYNHVPSKEAVLDEMVRALLIEAELPHGDIRWQDWVRQFATAMRRLAQRHPGAFEAFHHGPAQGEPAATAFEAAFAAFHRGGFDPTSAYSAFKATVVAVLGLVLEESVPRRSRVRRTDVSGLSPERFPNIHKADRVAADADTFTYMIECLIAGFATRRRDQEVEPT
jgi:AcrR family transcriptional regulator